MDAPTLFLRDAEGNLADEIDPAQQWVPEGEGTPTRLYEVDERAEDTDPEDDVFVPVGDVDYSLSGISTLVRWQYKQHGWEGVVWVHADGRTAAVKATDIGLPAHTRPEPEPEPEAEPVVEPTQPVE